MQPAALLPAWVELRETVPDFRPIRNEKDYKRMAALMDKLLGVVGDDESHPLADFLDVVSTLVERYEEHVHGDDFDVAPREALRLLMDEHDLKQSELSAELGGQGIVSEILSGKREINARQARALAKRFGVSTSVFI